MVMPCKISKQSWPYQLDYLTRTPRHLQVPSPNSGPSLVPELMSGSSSSSGGSGGGGDRPHRSPLSIHPDMPRASGGSGVPDIGDMGSGLPNADSDVEGSAEMDEMFVDEPPALRSFYADIRRQQQQQQQQSASGRDRGSLADPTRQLRSAAISQLRSAGDSAEHRRVNVADCGSLASERSPLISDGKLLYIMTKSNDKPAQAAPHHHHHHHDMHDDDEDSSEGGGQIGSTWAVASFTLDVYDPADGMRLVRSVGIKGPACEQGMREGEAEISLCCDVCGLLMSGSMVGYRCLVCAPEYDLCQHCHMRGAANGGHRPEHAVRQMDPGPSHESVGDQVLLTAFPAECLESQSFYCDGKVLMVLIPPHLFGSKTPGYLCRVFCAHEGRHLYDISMGDSQDDARRGLGKQAGAACFDCDNDLVWHVDCTASRARRWRHPWTWAGEAKEEWQRAKELPKNATLADALQSILACLYSTSEKLSRSVQEPCHDALQPWTPFSVEAVPEMFAAILRILGMCTKQEQATQHIVRTCMRLLQVNLGHVSGQASKLTDSLHQLREHVLRLAGSPPDEQQDAEEQPSFTCNEAGCALIAGLDVFYPDAEQQAKLLCEMLSKGGPGDRVLPAIATQLSCPGSRQHIFRIFDGTWLKASEQRQSLAQRLLTLLLNRVVSCKRDQQDLNGAGTNSSCGYLLSLLGAFQRHLLSTPLSSGRATAESEQLLVFYAKHLMIGCNELLNATLSEASMRDNTDRTSAGVQHNAMRVLLLPFATALVDPVWSHNVSCNLARQLLNDLRELLVTCDAVNGTSGAIKYQDLAFAVRCTEPRYIGGKIVSIPRTRNAKACCVKIPGASSMIVRLGEDTTLGKRESLRIQSCRDSSSPSSTSNTIKGHKGKRLWRSFMVQGDTVYITYARTGSSSDDPKSPRMVRCSVYGCARNAALLMPLDWMLDLELTLAALFARMSRTIMRELPQPLCRSPWLTSPFLERGLRLNLLDQIEPRRGEAANLADCVSASEQAEGCVPSGDAMQVEREEVDQVIRDLLGNSGDSSKRGLASFVMSKLQPASASNTMWKSSDVHITLGLHCVAALLAATGLTHVASSFHTGESGEQPPAEIMFVVQAAMDIVQSVIMEARRQQQMAVLKHAEEVDAASSATIQRTNTGADAALEADASSETENKGAGRASGKADDMVLDDDLEAIKKRIGQACEVKIKGMQARARLLIACQAPDKEAWVSLLKSPAVEDQNQVRDEPIGTLSGEQAQAFRLCVKSATRFLMSDAVAESIAASAHACARIAAERANAISVMQAVLEKVELTSVKQILVSRHAQFFHDCWRANTCVHACRGQMLLGACKATRIAQSRISQPNDAHVVHVRAALSIYHWDGANGSAPHGKPRHRRDAAPLHLQPRPGRLRARAARKTVHIHDIAAGLRCDSSGPARQVPGPSRAAGVAGPGCGCA
jgi:hypothetical protein